MVNDLNDIKLCYTVIFTTQKGKIVHNPNLGWNMRKFLSKPIDSVLVPMKTELIKEFNYQEPRAVVQDVEFDFSGFAKGRLSVKIKTIYNGEIVIISINND